MNTNQLKKIEKYANSILEQDKTGHDKQHLGRVVSLAKKIAATEKCKLDIVVAAAYLHDTVDDKLVENEAEAYEALQSFLLSIGLSSEEIKEIFVILQNMSFSKSVSGEAEPLTIEGKIVQDADRLDAIGAIGIARTFYYGGNKGHKMYDLSIPPRKLLSKEQYRINETVINHFYEKLLLLKDQLNTQEAKRLAEKRHQLMELFLAEFLEEVDM